MEGCLFRRNSDPTWSAARDDAAEVASDEKACVSLSSEGIFFGQLCA